MTTTKTTIKRTISDGWHTISGYRVQIEDGYITHGVTDDGQLPLYVYRACLKRRPMRISYDESLYYCDGWDRVYHITPDAFRAGVRRGTIIMS